MNLAPILLTAALIANPFLSQAADMGHLIHGTSQSEESYKYDHYFILQKTTLLDFTEVAENFPAPSEKYNRDKHFGGWVHPVAGSCLNTRAQVLVRDAINGQVYLSGGCSVKSGDWLDPYSQKKFFNATDLQIDHVVPLKHAYMTGASDWNFHKRCLYANYLGNKFHLLPVSGKENQIKGDKGPREYMPPAHQFECDYLRSWLKIKKIWNLKLTPPEADDIKKQVRDYQCDESQFTLSDEELQQQQQFQNENQNLCAGSSVQMQSFDSKIVE